MKKQSCLQITFNIDRYGLNQWKENGGGGLSYKKNGDARPKFWKEPHRYPAFVGVVRNTIHTIVVLILIQNTASPFILFWFNILKGTTQTSRWTFWGWKLKTAFQALKGTASTPRTIYMAQWFFIQENDLFLVICSFWQWRSGDVLFMFRRCKVF